jgi:CheY-like chemotaxis protein
MTLSQTDDLAVQPGTARSSAGRILFVDDEPVMRRNVWHALTRAGYSVALAEDGVGAWNALSAEAFDLLITDSQMPGLSGEELVIRLRRHGLKLPVIVAAARIEFFLRSENRYLQVAAVLSKPFFLRDLTTVVRGVLSAETFAVPIHHPPEK